MSGQAPPVGVVEWMPFHAGAFWDSERVAVLSNGAAALLLWILWRRYSAGPLGSRDELRDEAPERFRQRWPLLWSELEPIVAHGDEVLLADGALKTRALQRADARRAYLADGANAAARLKYETRRDRLAAARELGKHTEEEWLAIRGLAAGICPRCAQPATLEKDHVVPLHLGGSDAASNLQPLCKACNVTKRRETIDWLASRGLR